MKNQRSHGCGCEGNKTKITMLEYYGNRMGKKSPEVKTKALQRLIDDFKAIYFAPDDGNQTWKGSKADLYEMAYYAYINNVVCDDDGIPATFAQIVHRLCSRFHLTELANASSFARRAIMRKGVRRPSLLDRYEYRAAVEASVSP